MTIPASFAMSTLDLAALARELQSAYSRLLPAATGLGASSAVPNKGRRVLITGGGGFLGVHLLAALVASQGFGKIYLLARRPQFLVETLQRYKLDSRILDNIQIVQGDLRDMPKKDFPDVDVVIHSAARIHGLKSLRQLWADNVEATARLFAHYRGQAELYLVSTLSVFVSSNSSGEHLPAWVEPSKTRLLYGGYAQSKYICEYLAQAAGAHVVRLGLLTGASTVGRFPENDFFSVFLRTMREMGCMPSGYADARVDVTPVDLAAARIVQYLEDAGRPTIVHIANQSAVSVSDICRQMKLLPVDTAEFKDRLAQLPGIERVLLTYAFFKKEALESMPGYFNIDLFQSTGNTYGIAEPFPIANELLVSLYLTVADLSERSE